MTKGPLFWFIWKTEVLGIGPKVVNQLKNPKSQINCLRYIHLTESRSFPLIT